MNNVQLVGALKDAPRQFGDGNKYCSLAVETVKAARTLNDGRTIEEKRLRHNVICFGSAAEAAKSLQVDDIVQVLGELQYYPVMTADGSAAARANIVANYVSKVYY